MSSSSDEIFLLSATELLSLYRRKQLSPVEATRAVFDRIRACDGAVNAFCLLGEEAARKRHSQPPRNRRHGG